MAMPGMEGLLEYSKSYADLLRERFLSGIDAFAYSRQPAHLWDALNPTGPLIEDAAVQAGGLLAPQMNELSQTFSQGSENLGLGPLSVPDVTGEDLAPLLMLGMGRMPKGGRITDRIIAPDPVGELRRKLNRKPETGATQPRTVLEKGGQKMVVGDVTFDDWAERTTKMKPGDIQDYRKWAASSDRAFPL